MEIVISACRAAQLVVGPVEFGDGGELALGEIGVTTLLLGSVSVARRRHLQGSLSQRQLLLRDLDLGRGAIDLGLPLIDHELERLRIDREQLVADLDLLVVDDVDLDDLAGHLGRHRHQIGADIGIVGEGDE